MLSRILPSAVLILGSAAFLKCAEPVSQAPDGGSVFNGGHDGGPDGGDGGDGGSPDASNPDGGGPPSCGNSAWATYAHDGGRTSATDACISGPLISRWRYVPEQANAVFHAIAQEDAIFLSWRSPDPPYLGSTRVDRISPLGEGHWSFDGETDTNMGNWLSFAFGAVVTNDDGLSYLATDTGSRIAFSGVDWWGQTLPDEPRLYVVNNVHVDGPGIGVGAYDEGAQQLWRQNEFGECRIDAADRIGALALDGGVLFYAAQYVTGEGVMLPFDSGLYAFEADTGQPLWYQATVPKSAISVGHGNVYLIEGTDLLVARSQVDGSIVWSSLIPGVGPQAPVLANGLVIVASFSHVVALDAHDGAPRWDALVTGAAGSAIYVTFSGGCAGLLTEGGAIRSTLAAALGSGTLLVTENNRIHLLQMIDGAETWSGTVELAVGAVHDPVLLGKKVYVVDSGDFMNSAGVIALESP